MGSGTSVRVGDFVLPLRMAGWMLVLVMQGFLLATGCTPSSQAAARRGTAIVIFVDFSQSVRSEARALFR